MELKVRGGRGGRGRDNDGVTILVGSKSSRALLGSKNIGLGGGRGGMETKEVAVDLVGAEGRGVENMICRVVVDGWVGVDVEVEVEW